jgi:hypothetical protein
MLAQNPPRINLQCVVLDSDNCSSTDCVSPEECAPATRLSNSKTNEVVHQASTKDPVGSSSSKTETNTGEGLDEGGRVGVVARAGVVGGGSVVEEIKNTDTSESLGDDVGQDGRGRVCVHLAKAESTVVDLGEGVDDDEDVGDVETVCVPEECPGCGGRLLVGTTSLRGLRKYLLPMQRLPRT